MSISSDFLFVFMLLHRDTVNHKKSVPVNCSPCLWQILTDFYNSFTGTHCGQFARNCH